MKSRAIFTVLALATLNVFAGLPDDYVQLKTNAEKLFADGSYAKAHDQYARAQAMTNLPADEVRWVAFRVADTQWRSQAATQNPDTSQLDAGRSALEKQIRDLTRENQHDRVWAETEESLGDYYWTRRYNNNWSGAWPYYQAALDWWAGAADINTARTRYLAIVWRMAKPAQAEPYYYYGYWGNFIPQPVLENALKIAQNDEDKAHAHYLVAMNLRSQGTDLEMRARVSDEFESAIRFGKKTEWYDDALYNYAGWMQSQGKAVQLADGTWNLQPDYVKALELFRRFTKEFTKSESRYWDDANNQINNITGKWIGVGAANVFLPDSEIQYNLDWRNVKKVELSLYAVDLNIAVSFPAESKNSTDWLHSINLSTQEKIKSWQYDTKDKGDYQPGNEMLRLGKLKPGAYVIEANGEGVFARDLILVSDATVVLKNSGKQALVYLCNALNGAPLGQGKVKLWTRWWDNDKWHATSEIKDTDTNGIAVFEVKHPQSNNNIDLFATAVRGDREAFSEANSYWYDHNSEPWRIYAFTDRPAYRPTEKANWKFVARHYNGSVYSTPANETIEYEIEDARGSKVKEDKVKLNSFGSTWGSLELTDKMPLGEYRINFWDEGRKNHIGDAMLFRLEEYKLPEFKVSVNTPEETNSDNVVTHKAFKLGDTVEAEIDAEYYFGGPVANADVEVLVHQSPYWHYWHSPREFPWLYEDMDNNSPNGRYGRWYGGDQIIKNETIKTDAAGKAHVSFDSQRGAGQDYEYRIEARVTDASRREITGSGSVRVTQQRYYVDAEASHNLYRPQDKVTVDFHALDANDQPMQTEGKVAVTLDYWYEIWIAPDGREVKGAELKLLQDKEAFWPPRPTKPNLPGWTLKFRGYQHDEILTRTLKTDTNGTAQLEFKPEREGYYRIAWASEDAIAQKKYEVANPIHAETTVWVAKNSTSELGYRHGGVEIIADKDTFRVGQRAPVMLVAPTRDRYVLFTVEGEDMYNYQLVYLEGTVKLIELPIEEKHVPNIFLGAALVSDRQLFMDSKQIVVPPTKNFLTVDVKPDAAAHQPREDGTLTVTTKNDEGKPVPAEVALSFADDAVSYIQSDYAGDPRQFYYGTKREEWVHTQATMQHKTYTKLIVGEKEQLIDDEIARQQWEAREGASAQWDDSDILKKDLSLSDGENRRELGFSRTRGFGGGGAGGFGGSRFISGYAVNSATLGMPASPPAAEMPAVSGMVDQKQLESTSLAYRLVSDKTKSPAGEEPPVVVRSDFRSTIFWQPDVTTDKDGHATVTIKYPDSLTTWKAIARAVSTGNQFGIGDTTTRTRQPLIVRLEAPRFFVVGDTVTISAVVNNNTESDMTVQPEIELGGVLSDVRLEPAATLKVPANGEARADWALKISKPGDVKLKVTARGGNYADAMEKTFTAYDHGIEKFIAKSGKARANDFTLKLDLPHERKEGSTTFTVQVTPSMAVTMLDALPYLIDYPYGCTEQTMSRFLPSVITAKTLRDVGLKPEDVIGRIFGGIETNSAAATHPDGKKNLDQLDAMTQASLKRLYDFHHGDGGWGWWKEGESDHWMTAYVVWGLSLARDAGVKVDESILSSGANYLAQNLVKEEENPDMQAWMLHALGAYYLPYSDQIMNASVSKASDNLWNRRDQLNAYTRALFALSQQYLHNNQRAKTLVENLENGVIRDERPDESVLINGGKQSTKPETVMGTAHWGNDGIYWRWSEGGVESTAFALRAMLAIDPTNQLIEPVSNWLVKNRRGAQWNNTRDTAITVLALNDYLKTSGELNPNMEYEVFVNGTSVAKKKVSGADVFDAPSRFTVDSTLIKDSNEVRIVRKGETPVYFATEAKFYSLEEPIAPAGNEIFVKREYFKLAGRPTLLKGLVYDREPLRDGESVKSGERVECVVTIEAKNDYDYLLFEDLKPAGFEAVEVRSGESLYAKQLKSASLSQLQTQNSTLEGEDFTGQQRWVYQELRDRQTALFIDHLPQGVWQLQYDYRAEVPGKFHALPVLGQAMYVPEIRANSAELRVTVEDAK